MEEFLAFSLLFFFEGFLDFFHFLFDFDFSFDDQDEVVYP